MNHGRAGTYCHDKCRCDPCRKAWGDYYKRWRARQKTRGVPEGVNHGSRATYVHHHCRCFPCRLASAAYQQERRDKRKQAAA